MSNRPESVDLVAAVRKLVRAVHGAASQEGGTSRRTRLGYWPAATENAGGIVRLGDLVDAQSGGRPFVTWFSTTPKWRGVGDCLRAVREQLTAAPSGAQLLAIHFRELQDAKVCEWGVCGPARDREVCLDGDTRAGAFPVVVTSYPVDGQLLDDLTAEAERVTLLAHPDASGETSAPPDLPANILRRVGGSWNIRFAGGTLTALPDLIGLWYIRELLRKPGRRISVEQLDAVRPHQQPTRPAAGPPVEEGAVSAGEGRDGGERADDQAIDAVEKRVRELVAEVKKARRNNDHARLSELEKEQEDLQKYLSAVQTRQGRPRVGRGHATRVYERVLKGIGTAISVISDNDPAMGAHLVAFIDRGRSCMYEPNPPIDWHIT